MAALSREPTMRVAQEKAPTKLLFKKLQTVSGLQEIVVIALGDQAPRRRFHRRLGFFPWRTWASSRTTRSVVARFILEVGVCCNFVERPAHMQCEMGLVQRSSRWLFARVS